MDLFAKLNPEQLAKVAESLACVEFGGSAVIITKGEPGDCFYLVRTGGAVVSDGTRQLGEISPGGSFGERALLTDEVRAAHITAGPLGCALFALSRDAFKAALAMVDEVFRADALRRLPQLPAALAPPQLAAACAAMERVLLPTGEAFLGAAQAVDGIVLVEEGSLAVTEQPPGWAMGLSLSRGAAFGAESLADAGAAHALGAVLAAGPDGVTLLRLRRAAFVALYGTLEMAEAAQRVAALRRVPLLAALPPDAMLALAASLVPLTFQPGEPVVRQGDPGDAFFLLDKGTATVQDAAGKVYGHLREGCYFGELALQAKAGEGVRAATIIAAPGAGELRVLRMTRDAFAAMRAEHPAVAAGLAAGEAGYAPVAYTARLGLKDLQLSRALGVGTFGKVFLATHRGNKYALKQVAKAHVVAKGLVAHIKRERDVMAECDSPFLVALTASFQDAQALYLLMELVLGGELFYYLQGLRTQLPEAAGRFYTACVVEAFDFLHTRHYIYRDLKPENLLITATGYIKVADYSFAKRLRGGKTFTLCGTPAYLAPEQITRAGHDRAVDWWALGVLTYELLAGTSPFYHDDDMTMFKRIVDVKCARWLGAGTVWAAAWR